MSTAKTDDIAEKAAAMLEFRKYRDAGLPVPPEVRARHVQATNDRYATGPEPGEKIPEFALPDQQGALRTLENLAGPNGLFLVFHRSAEWCQYCRSSLVELELSRKLFEDNGVRLAAISYDAQDKLALFSQQQSIGYPLLSDRDSAVIRRFGIANLNMAPGLKAHGVPHPVEYLVSADGTVIRKYFVPNYMHRVTGSSVALREFSAVSKDASTATLKSGAFRVIVGFASGRAFSGQEVGFFAKFAVQPGWHVYGSPLPPAYTATTLTFDQAHVLRQDLQMPEAAKLHIPVLGETLPVYSSTFEARGTLLLKHPLPQGSVVFKGRLDFQLCSDTICEPPQTLPFELLLDLQTFVISERERKLNEQQKKS